jgi:hypothetical protein
MALPDDDDLEFESDAVNESSTSIPSTNTSNKDWLQSQLQAYSTAITAADKKKAEIFKEATDKLLARQKQLEEPDWFGIAAALGRPTRTGSIGEEFANVNEVLSARRKEQRAGAQQLEDLMMKYKLAEADRGPERLKDQLSLGIQLQKAMPKERMFEIQALEKELANLPADSPRRKVIQGRIDKLNYVPPAKTDKQPTLEQWANQILLDEEKVPGTHPTAAVDRAKQIIKKQTYIPQENKPVENLSLEQWANKVLSEENKKPGTHSKPDIARANQIIRKATYIKPEKGEGEGTPKALSPAGKLAADRGFKPGTPEYAGEVNKIVQSGKHLSSTQEKELFEQEDVLNSSKSALLNLDKALALSPKAYEGGAAELRMGIGTYIPGVKSSEAQVASSEFNSIMGEQMLSQLKAIFGGNPTEGERKVLAQLQGSLGMSHAARAPIIRNAMAAVRRRLKAAEDRIKGIKSGAYGPDVPEMAQGGPVKMQRGGRTDTSGSMSMANIGRAVGQGLGMSFGDEAIARVRAQMEGRPYEEVLAEERAAYEAFAKRHPITALSTEIASGVVPTVGMMLMPGGQAAAGANIVRTAPTMGRLARTGAITGGISGYGAGESNDLFTTERLPSAGMGAGFGAVVGPVASKAGNAVGTGYRWLKDKLTPSVNSVDQAAMRKVLQAMGRDEMDVAGVRQRMARDQQLGVKSTIADTSPSVTNLAEAVVTAPGKGKKRLGQKLEERLEEGREGVAQRVQQDVAQGSNYVAKEDQLVNTLRKNARNVYETAYAFGAVDDPRIAKVLDDDTFKSAYDKARSIISKEVRAAELRGEDVSKYQLKPIYKQDADGNWVRTGEIPDVQTLDYLKRGIDALIEQGYSSERSISKAEAGALKDLKNAFVNVIDEVVPDYRTARATYRGDAEVLDALRFGREDFLSPKNTPDRVIKQLQAMSTAEKEALRTGAAQTLLSRILETPNQVNAAQRVIGAPSTRKRLNALFDDPNQYKVFEEALKREAELFRNAQNILRNSRTENRKQAIEDLKKAPGILDIAGEAVDFANAGPGSIVGRTLKLLQSRATFDEKTADEVANILRAGTPQEINAVLDKLEQSAGKFAREAERSNVVQKGITRGVGSAAGEPPRTPEPERLEETDDERLERLLRD